MTVIRLVGAFMVLVGHSFVLTGNVPPSVLGMSIHTMGVKIFFVVSGYLIATSWLADPNIIRYFIRRGLRLFPALILLILITTLILGPVFTQLTLQGYFSSNRFALYYYNIALYISYSLPGVFSGNEFSQAVNGSLWTLPVEFLAYMILPFVAYQSKNKFVKLFSVVVVVVFIGIDLYLRTVPPQNQSNYVIYGTNMIFAAQLLSYFWGGYLVRVLRLEKFLSISVSIILIIVAISIKGNVLLYNNFAYLIIPYVVLSFAYGPRLVLPGIGKNDYSYGLYLYSFPMQQAVGGINGIGPWTMVFLAGAAAGLLAMISWHLVERPALNMKPFRSKKSKENEVVQAEGKRYG